MLFFVAKELSLFNVEIERDCSRVITALNELGIGEAAHYLAILLMNVRGWVLHFNFASSDMFAGKEIG